jgi:hypothetical protein
MMRVTAFLSLLLLSGCAWTSTVVGGSLPSAEALVVGRSTTPEALAALGPPRLVRQQFDGALYTWRRTESRSRSITILPIYVKAFHYSSGESRRDDLSLFFDREGVLRGVGERRETEEDGD